MQCSSVAEAHPKQFPSLSGAAEAGDERVKALPSPDIGVAGVAGSLVGETFPE